MALSKFGQAIDNMSTRDAVKFLHDIETRQRRNLAKQSNIINQLDTRLQQQKSFLNTAPSSIEKYQKGVRNFSSQNQELRTSLDASFREREKLSRSTASVRGERDAFADAISNRKQTLSQLKTGISETSSQLEATQQKTLSEFKKRKAIVSKHQEKNKEAQALRDRLGIEDRRRAARGDEAIRSASADRNRRGGGTSVGATALAKKKKTNQITLIG